MTTSLFFVDGALNINLGANTTLYIDQDMDLTGIDLSIVGSLAIVLADDATLTLTADQADGLNIISGPDTGTLGIGGVVDIVGLGDTPVDLSGIAANIAGTVTLEDNDVSLDALTDLGFFTVQLEAISDTDGNLSGQTIRFTTVAQAERAVTVVDLVSTDGDNAGFSDLDGATTSTNVVWLFTAIPAPVDTSGYSADLGRLWITDDLIAAQGGLVENLFTTLPFTILRVEFADVTFLDSLLASQSVDRTVEMVNFMTVGNLTFSDIGVNPDEHLRNLTLELGGQVTVGNILIDDVVAPGTDPATVNFNTLTIESHRALRGGDVLPALNHYLAAEGFTNDNDLLGEPGEHVQPSNLNTVGNIGVGAVNGLDLLTVTLDTLGVSVVGDGSLGEGAILNVGTITYGTNDVGSTARLNVTGDNDITIAAINTADTDITGLTLDATGFTAVLDPVMHMDNTETLTIQNDGGAPEPGPVGSNGTITLEEVEGNELSTINASGFDGDLNVTLSQIDSTNDDSTPGGTNDGLVEAFTFTAGQGVETVAVKQVGANVPTLNTGSEWVFDFTGAAAGSSLTISDTAVIQAGATLSFTDVPVVIEGNVDLSDVTLNNGGSTAYWVPAGQTLTLDVQQLEDGFVQIWGSGTLILVGDGANYDIGADGLIQTVGLDLSAVILDPLNLPSDTVLDVNFFTSNALDDNGDPAGYVITGSANDDLIWGSVYADDINGAAGNDTIYGGFPLDASGDSPVPGGIDDTLTGGTDGAALGENDVLIDARGNTLYNVDSGTDVIGSSYNNVNTGDVLVVAAGATADVTIENDLFPPFDWGFVATAATVNNGTANLTLEATGADGLIDVSAAGGSNGFNLTGDTTNGFGQDTLTGSAQDDVINGGNDNQVAGAEDLLTGNGGADRFEFNVGVNAAAAMALATTTAAIDRELINVNPDALDITDDETVTVNYTVNGIVGAVLVTLGAAVDVTDATATAAAIAAAVDTAAGVGATSAGAVVTMTGDNGASLTITSLVWAGSLSGLETSTTANGTDVAQVTTLTLSGTPTPGDIYSLLASLAEGGGAPASYTAVFLDGSPEVAAGLSGSFASGDIGDGVVGSVVTFTDANADNGGFTVVTDTTAAFSGSGASDIGATSLASADVITDFLTGVDVIDLNLSAGSGSNYVEAAAAVDFTAARTAADTAFNGTVQYYLTSATAEDTGLLFFDANLDGDVDGVVALTGITSANFAAADIVA